MPKFYIQTDFMKKFSPYDYYSDIAVVLPDSRKLCIGTAINMYQSTDGIFLKLYGENASSCLLLIECDKQKIPLQSFRIGVPDKFFKTPFYVGFVLTTEQENEIKKRLGDDIFDRIEDEYKFVHGKYSTFVFQ